MGSVSLITLQHTSLQKINLNKAHKHTGIPSFRLFFCTIQIFRMKTEFTTDGNGIYIASVPLFNWRH